MSDLDERRNLITATWAAAWDRGEVDALDDLLSPEYRRKSSPTEEGLDLAAFKASILAARSAFPDLKTTIEQIVIEGDSAAVRWRSHGRHDHGFLGVPATHRDVEVHGATFARFQGDKVVEELVTWDPRALLSAIGIISVGQDS